MVLRALGCTSCDMHQLRRLSQTTSVWTVDLAHLLARFGAAVTFCTITIGINGDYANEWFYMEHLEDDEKRVQQLFSQAAQLGIRLQECSVPLQELVAAVASGRQLAILLVDRRKIDPWQAAADMAWNYTTGVTSATGYTGHYILLVGYEPPAAAAPAGSCKPAAAGKQSGGSGCSCSSNSSCSSNQSSSSMCCCSGEATAADNPQQQPAQQLAGQQEDAGNALAEPGPVPSSTVSNNSSSSSREQAAAGSAQHPSAAQSKVCASMLASGTAHLGYFWVQDPAHSRGPVRIPVAVVESARKTFGTDEDILLIDVPAGSAMECSSKHAAAAAGAAPQPQAPQPAAAATVPGIASWLGLGLGTTAGAIAQGAQQQQQQQQQQQERIEQQQQYEQCAPHCEGAVPGPCSCSGGAAVYNSGGSSCCSNCSSSNSRPGEVMQE
jgi:hypothetical protein